MNAPRCPHCGERVAYDEAIEDATRCPHCRGPIIWTVPFGFMDLEGGTFKRSRRGPTWRVRVDYCAYCRKAFSENTLVKRPFSNG